MTIVGLRVGVLGPLEVRDETGATLVVPGARLAALLVRLALEGGRPVPAATLIEDLWGGAAPHGELNALQSLVSRLRRALGSTSRLTQGAGGYRLQLAVDGLDLLHFRRLAADGRRRLRADDPHGAQPLLTEAVELWRGSVCPELDLVAPGLGAALEDQHLDAVVDLIECEQRLGNADASLDRLALLRARHPRHERLALLEMRALVAAERIGDALRVYDRMRRELADSLGIDPSPALQEAHRLALAADARPPATATAGNLPAAVTSFVGRDEESDQVAELLRTSRLVTVLGPGGAGKTRLALESGRRRQQAAQPSDVWLVELAGVTDEADVPQAVLAALGLREGAMLDRRAAAGPPREIVELLVDRFAGHPVLLILDNCEHVIVAAATLTAELLAACPDLTVLATSREPLAIDGEFLVPLSPLAVPVDGGRADGTADGTAELPSVQLFLDRARAVQPGFALEGSNRNAVEEIVRRLDGLPLAIELAAARMRTLPVTEIADRLSDRFRLLTTGSRAADPRHRTLRAVVAWSWDLLDPAERLLAERVAVFPAGLTGVGAAEVCADPALAPGLSAADIPDLLDALVDKSLLQLSRTGARYRVLETIREYGQDRLAERGELDAVRLAAARHFAALVAEADPHLRGPGQLTWLERLRVEHDNVVAALRTFCDAGDADAALRLVLDFGWYWFLLGRYAEAGGWAQTALELPGPAAAELVRDARTIAALSELAASDWTTAPDQQADHADLVAEMEAVPLVGRVLPNMFAPSVLFLLQAGVPARRRLDELVRNGDAWLSAAGRLMRASFAENAGELTTVREDSELALASFRRIGDLWGVATALPMTGLMRLYDSDLDGALDAFLEAERVSELFGSLNPGDELFLALRLADVRLRRGEIDEVRTVIERARRLVERAARSESLVIFYALAAMTERAIGDLSVAHRLQRQSEAALAQVREGPLAAGHGVAIVSTSAATLAVADNDLSRATQRLSEGYAAALRSRDYPILAIVGVTVADLAVALGRFREAAVILGAAARLRGADDPTQIDIARIRTTIVATLGPDDEAAATAEGFALDVAAAIRRLDPALLGDASPTDDPPSRQALRL